MRKHWGTRGGRNSDVTLREVSTAKEWSDFVQTIIGIPSQSSHQKQIQLDRRQVLKLFVCWPVINGCVVWISPL